MQCSPFHTAALLHPVFRHLEQAAGFAPQDTAEAKLDKLEVLLRHAPSLRPIVAAVRNTFFPWPKSASR